MLAGAKRIPSITMDTRTVSASTTSQRLQTSMTANASSPARFGERPRQYLRRFSLFTRMLRGTIEPEARITSSRQSERVLSMALEARRCRRRKADKRSIGLARAEACRGLHDVQLSSASSAHIHSDSSRLEPDQKSHNPINSVLRQTRADYLCVATMETFLFMWFR
jgi:hypothetical protein